MLKVGIQIVYGFSFFLIPRKYFAIEDIQILPKVEKSDKMPTTFDEVV